MSGIVAGAGVVAAVVALLDARRWWHRCRVVSRGALPRPDRPPPIVVVRALAAAGLDVDPRLALRLWGTGLVVAVVLAVVGPIGPIVAVVALVGPPAAVLANRHRGARRRSAQVPLALDAIAGALRAGVALRTAIGDAASIGPPLGPELAQLTGRAERGVPLATAVDDWAAAAPDPTSDLAAAALAVAASVGGPGADALDAAAASLRDRAAADAEARSLSVQARLSAVVLSAAPIVFAVLLGGIDPASSRFLFATPAGWLCLGVGLGLDLLGAWWMHRLVRGTR